MKSIFGVSILKSRFLALLCLQAAALSSAFVWAQSPSQAENQLAAQTAERPSSYLVTDLGQFEARGINDKGQAVGLASGAILPPRAALWQDGKFTALGTLGGATSTATGINNNGQVVGYSFTGHGMDSHAFLWQNGRMVDLGTLGGAYSAAFGINDRGQVVGSSTIPGGPPGQAATEHSFLWQDGRMVDLGTLGGNSGQDAASAINDRGQVVGWSVTASGSGDAFLWQNGQMTDIAGGPGLAFQAEGINQRGQVAGFSIAALEGEHVFLWQNGQTINLGPGSALGINEKGQVVGLIEPGEGALWQDGKLFVLNTLVSPAYGQFLSAAFAINNVGQIAGEGYLLTPLVRVDATLQLSSESWRFGVHAVGETSGPGTIWIYNSGTQSAHFSVIQFIPAIAQDFSITENTCGSALPPFNACKIVFHFTPTAAGKRNASLALNDNANDGPHFIPVQGFGSSK